MATATCPACNDADVYRIYREGILDNLFRVAGMWPWKCNNCGRRYRSHLRTEAEAVVERRKTGRRETGRRKKEAERPPQNGYGEKGSAAQGPAFEYRTAPGQPTAAIVVRANTEHQLTSILLALSEAVSREQDQPAGERVRR